MITINIYGLDQFVVGRLSREITPNLARIYEVEEDEINFISTNNMVFHNGVEQTSWNAIMHVHTPMKVSVLQDQVAKILMEMIKGVAIHIAVEFYYYSQDNRYQLINDDYPRFITDDNVVNYDEEYYEDDECEDDDCEHHHDENEEDIYTGDIFEGILDK